MARHLIHKSGAELELVNGKLDQLVNSDVLKNGLAAIVTELAAIKERTGLPTEVAEAIRKIPKKLDNIADEIQKIPHKLDKVGLPNDVEDAIRKIPYELAEIAKEIDHCCGEQGTVKSKAARGKSA
jgi:hypothetical protein